MISDVNLVPAPTAHSILFNLLFRVKTGNMKTMSMLEIHQFLERLSNLIRSQARRSSRWPHWR